MSKSSTIAGMAAQLAPAEVPAAAATIAPKRHRAPNRPNVEYCAQCGEMLRANIGHSSVQFGEDVKKVHLGCVAEALLDGASFVGTHRFKKEA
jgi:hypothetical protein